MSDAAKVLIVDDEPNIRLVFRATLESAGYDVAEAEDGTGALGALRGNSVDLVFLDLRLPGMDGLEVLRRLREGGDDTPVVIVTAHGDVPNAVQAMKLGAIDFLTKPMSPEMLRKVAREVLSRHVRVPSPSARSQTPEPVTVASQFALDLSRAKWALNRRQFDEAEAYLKQAVGLDEHSAEVHNLMGVLHELRNEHDASYRCYKAALKADRRYEPAQHNMARYYERFTFGASEVPVDLGDR
ncbi:MAG: response regulator [Isosphaeraceae bacterium]|nr:response regulator [Isosphaeraceae bacterium]